MAPKGPNFWKCAYNGSLTYNLLTGKEKNRIDEFLVGKFNFEKKKLKKNNLYGKISHYSKMVLKLPDYFHVL